MNGPSRVARLLQLHPPERGDSAERHATWLELFYDLAFVLALSAVAARLGTGSSPSGRQLLIAFGVYVLVQWAWIGPAFYDTRFDPDDVPHRLLVLGAAAGAGAIALGARPHSGPLLLPIGYLVVRGALIVMYLRVLGSGERARRLVYIYLTGFGAGWLLWLGSLALPPERRPTVWVVAFVIELLTPWLGRRWLVQFPVDTIHLPERIGQFTIILLGSTLVNLRDGVPDEHPPPRALLAAGVALVVPMCVWWVYTTFLTSRLAVPRLRAGQGYAYLHAPTGAAILFLGWALGQVVREVAVGAHRLPMRLRLVLGASVIAWMLCGLGLRWFSLGSVSRVRIVIAVAGAVPIAAVTALVSRPELTLGLLAAVLAGYATINSREIGWRRAEAAAAQAASPSTRAGPGGPGAPT